MKALLSLNESTVEEIIMDLLNVPEEQAVYAAKNMRLSEILDMIQELKGNNVDEATSIIKPHLSELKSGTGSSRTASQNQSQSTIKPMRPTVKGQNADTGEEMQTGQPAGGVNISMTDQDGNELYSKNVKKSGAMRAVRQLPKSAKGSSIRNIAGLQ
tara:strand:+ start:3311 stop:3781 length:471 start_codon:yes stop_codon:yes gene_type:complete